MFCPTLPELLALRIRADSEDTTTEFDRMGAGHNRLLPGIVTRSLSNAHYQRGLPIRLMPVRTFAKFN